MEEGRPSTILLQTLKKIKINKLLDENSLLKNF